MQQVRDESVAAEDEELPALSLLLVGQERVERGVLSGLMSTVRGLVVLAWWASKA